MASTKDESTKIIQEQPDDISFDEILRELAFSRMVDSNHTTLRHYPGASARAA